VEAEVVIGSDGEIIAEWSDGFQRHVSCALHGPLIVLLDQDGADQSGDGGFVGKSADEIAAPSTSSPS